MLCYEALAGAFRRRVVRLEYEALQAAWHSVA